MYKPSSPVHHSERTFENGSYFSFKHFDGPYEDLDFEVPPAHSEEFPGDDFVRMDIDPPPVSAGDSDSTSTTESHPPQVRRVYHPQMNGTYNPILLFIYLLF